MTGLRAVDILTPGGKGYSRDVPAPPSLREKRGRWRCAFCPTQGRGTLDDALWHYRTHHQREGLTSADRQ